MSSLPRKLKSSAVPVTLSLFLVVCLVGIFVAFFHGFSDDKDVRGSGLESRPATVTTTVYADPSPVAKQPKAKPDPRLADFVDNSTGPQASFYRLSDGYEVGTATERFARPALSLAKLYIAEYVLEHGTTEQMYQAVTMISSSDDSMAAQLYETYPESIDEIAQEYGLWSTRGAEQWGYSQTSTYDVVHFIAQLIEKDPAHPILVAMSLSDPVAADGYGQDFGTSTLDGAMGTKWGWSDDLALHSAVTFGPNWVAAAAVTGGAEDLNNFVVAQLSDLVEKADAGES